MEITRAVADAVDIPVVASGGAGDPEHLHAILTKGKASAALAASIFHYGTYTIGETKRFLAERGVPVRLRQAKDKSRYEMAIGTLWPLPPTFA